MFEGKRARPRRLACLAILSPSTFLPAFVASKIAVAFALGADGVPNVSASEKAAGKPRGVVMSHDKSRLPK